MKLVIVNGSPKRKLSNTSKLLEGFVAGYEENRNCVFELFSVRDFEDQTNLSQMINKADYILLAFPLYTNAMQGRVKRFLEMLTLLSQTSKESNPKLLFLIQSGFPEALHSRVVERYLEKLCKRLNCEYMGTIIRGGIDTINQSLPSFLSGRVICFFQNQMKKIGKKFGETGELDQKLLKQIAFPEKLPWIVILFFKIYAFFGVHYFGFDSVLKENNMWSNRDATPYV
ncbi:MAG: hypothetical protein C0403_01235 [Desulfobacterium sp.]|nr:hypothetical protein [Desulfobacterium sp.]